MSFVLCRFFLRCWTSSYSTCTSVITDIVHRGVIHDDGLVVHVRNVPDVVHRSVVEEGAAIPIPALVAETFIPETVNNAAVEAHVRTPIALVKNIDAISPAPITGRPEESRFGYQNPCSRYPEEPVIPVSPIAGCPDVSLTGTKRLLVYR